MALIRCQVVGEMPIRDALTREPVHKGGVVVLNTEPTPRLDEDGRPIGTPLAGTLIRPLVEAGCVTVLGPHPAPPGPGIDSGE